MVPALAYGVGVPRRSLGAQLRTREPAIWPNSFERRARSSVLQAAS